MNETRKAVQPIADLLEYKIRSGRIANETGDKIWRIAIKNPGLADTIFKIIDMDLDGDETLAKVERLL